MTTTSKAASGKKTVKALVITGFGLNCERETAAAFELCGATAERIHLNDILKGERTIHDFHILAFIGGFSFGDHLGAGTVFANKVKHGLRKDIEKFVGDGKLVIGICNGFQTITRLGLVPALDGGALTQQVALDQNDSGVFRDDWISLRAEPRCPCVFTKGIDPDRTAHPAWRGEVRGRRWSPGAAGAAKTWSRCAMSTKPGLPHRNSRKIPTVHYMRSLAYATHPDESSA